MPTSRSLAGSPLVHTLQLILSLGTLPLCCAWGPVTHYTVSCAAVRPDATPADCMRGVVNYDLLTGSDMPDAFFFGAQPFMEASSCPPKAPALHDLAFAGFLFQAASMAPTGGAFNANDFARGYGSHVAADAVGFGNKNGYFARGPQVKGGIDWLYEWPLMMNVDGYILKNYSIDEAALPSKAVSSEALAFLARATASYQLLVPDFPSFSAGQLANCTAPWAQHLNFINKIASGSQPYAEQQLLNFDPYEADTMQQAASNVRSQLQCATQAVNFWLVQIQGGAPPSVAASTTMAHIQSLYKTGQCYLN